MIPLSIIVNNKNQEFGAIIYTKSKINGPWFFLSTGVPVIVNIPLKAKFVRFAYDQSGGNVYSSYEEITLPTVGVPVDSVAETNAIVRDISEINILYLLSDINTKVHLYFYSL